MRRGEADFPTSRPQGPTSRPALTNSDSYPGAEAFPCLNAIALAHGVSRGCAKALRANCSLRSVGLALPVRSRGEAAEVFGMLEIAGTKPFAPA
jgi:hypothetical protein